jgi:3,5-epimerase/4-reductase
MLRVLIWGHTGWIGGQLLKLLPPTHWIVMKASSRLQDVGAVETELKAYMPDRVILCAGLTGRPNVDWCEDHKEETANVNVHGTISIVQACHRLGIHICNFATGCIFEYDSEHPIGGKGFTEDDAPNFRGSFYSVTKTEAELATRNLPNHLLLRVRMPITADTSPRCFLTKISNYQGIVSVPNSMTILPDLLPLAVEMIRCGDTGVYNFVNPGPVSHSALLDAYRDIVDPLFTYTVISMEEHDSTRVVAKRSNNALDTTKLQKRFPGVVIPTALDSIRLLFMKNRPALRGQFLPTSILVTGGGGFIGCNFIKYLRTVSTNPVKITVLDKFEASSSKYLISQIPDVNVVVGDIGDCELVLDVLCVREIDMVIHFAAQTHVDNSFNNSFLFTETNVLGTHKLLHACHQYDKPIRFVHISTDEVYGETLPGVDNDGMSESRCLMPTNPYAASKVGAEAFVHAYHKSYKMDVVIVRANNVYGPGQYPEKVIPRFILRDACHLPIQIQGTGHQTRHFLYVMDAARAISTIASRGVSGEAYNIASDDELCILDLLKFLTSSKDVVFVKDRAFNDQRYWVHDGKLRHLGWLPQVSFVDGWKLTKEWYLDNIHNLGVIWPSYEEAIAALDE